MTAPRTVAVQLEAGGVLVLPCPTWCTTHEAPDLRSIHPTDVAHESTEQPVTVTIPDGTVVELLAVVIEHAPYSVTGSQRPYAAVRIGGDYYRFEVAGLHALADQIADRAPAALRAVADQLAAVLEEEPRGEA